MAKRVVVLALGFFVLFVCPATVRAQGLDGIPLLSELSRLRWFSTGSADDQVAEDSAGSGLGQWSPRLGFPRLCLAVSPEFSSVKLRPKAESSDGGDSAYLKGGIEWATNGLWVGLALPATFTTRLSLLVEGWYFLPGASSLTMSGQSTHTADGTNLISGDLNAKTDWFFTDLQTAYEYSEGFSILAGVRYDYLQGTMTARDDLHQWLGNAANSRLRARIDVNLNSIFPYLGLKFTMKDGRNVIGFFAKGSPMVLQIGQGALHTAYFAEIGMEYSFTLFRHLSLACFAKYDVAHGVFAKLTDVSDIFQRTPPRLGTMTVDQDFTVNWGQFTLGASAAFHFSLPL